jgi:succinyl-CoA synthetase alpha subunit
MPLLLEHDAGALVQGITGTYGDHYTRLMIDYGTQVVGGVTPGKGGEWYHGRPIFDTMARAVEATDARISLVAVPPAFAADAIFEAINAGIRTVVCITEKVPLRDALRVVQYARLRRVTLLGPSAGGVIVPGVGMTGVIPPWVALPGTVGVVARGGSLFYYVMKQLTRAGIGQSVGVSLGGDDVVGTRFRDVLEMMESDPNTDRIVLLGEAGGYQEQEAADYIRAAMTKPIVALVAGSKLLPNTRFGHSGCYVENVQESAESKREILRQAGVQIATNPQHIIQLLYQFD